MKPQPQPPLHLPEPPMNEWEIRQSAVLGLLILGWPRQQAMDKLYQRGH